MKYLGGNEILPEDIVTLGEEVAGIVVCNFVKAEGFDIED